MPGTTAGAAGWYSQSAGVVHLVYYFELVPVEGSDGPEADTPQYTFDCTGPIVNCNGKEQIGISGAAWDLMQKDPKLTPQDAEDACRNSSNNSEPKSAVTDPENDH